MARPEPIHPQNGFTQSHHFIQSAKELEELSGRRKRGKKIEDGFRGEGRS